MVGAVLHAEHGGGCDFDRGERAAKTVIDCARTRGRQGGGAGYEYAVYFLPRRTIACERILQEAGVAGDVVAGEYPLGFIPFDADLLSLEMPSVFRVRCPAACLGFFTPHQALWSGPGSES